MRTIYQLHRDLMDDMGISQEDIDEYIKSKPGTVIEAVYNQEKAKEAAKDKQLQKLEKLHTAIQNNLEEIYKHRIGPSTALMIDMVKLQIKDIADIAKQAIENS